MIEVEDKKDILVERRGDDGEKRGKEGQWGLGGGYGWIIKIVAALALLAFIALAVYRSTSSVSLPVSSPAGFNSKSGFERV